MHLVVHSYTLPLAVSALFSGSIALITWRRRAVKGAISLTVMMVGLEIWSGTYAIMWSSPRLDEQIFWLNATYIGVVVVPISFLVFVVQVTDNDRWLTRWNLLLLCIEPLVTLIIVWTNNYHHLFHTSFTLQYLNGWPELYWTRGPWFWVNVAYSYALTAVAVLILIGTALRASPYFRLQLLTILLGCFLPWGASIYAELFYKALRDLDLAPLSFGFSGIIFAYAMFNQRLLDILPVARSTLIEKMSDGMIVIDTHDRILDINPAAQRILLVDGKKAFGKNIRELYPEWSDYIESYSSQQGLHLEVQGRLDASRFYDITVSALPNNRGHINGRLISFRDITSRRESEAKLHQINTQLRRQVRKISRLRDELREQAIRDPLTDLFNRRYLTETLERELNRARRESYPISVIMLDVDNFKRINDTYGHRTGDRTLERLAAIIRGHIRGSDIPCRVGGEEFVIVLPATSVEIAAARAEYIRSHFHSAKHFKGEKPIEPTLSIGIAAFPAHGKRAEQILNAADEAMYAAKVTGNAIVIHPDKSHRRQRRSSAR